MPHTGRLVHQGDGLLLFAMGSLVVHEWNVELNADLLQRVLDEEKRILQDRAEGIASLMIVKKQRMRPPDAGVRAVMADMERVLAGQTRALCVVIEGSSLMSSAGRALMTGVQLAARSKYPSEVFATVEKGAAFIAAHLANGPTADEIVAEYRRFAKV